MKTINNALIRSFSPCYDPREKGIADDETLPVLEWVEKYRGTVPDEDILWLLLRNEFISDKDLRLFAVWCAREVLKLVKNPDIRSIEACNVAERYANGEATKEELYSAREAAREAAWKEVRVAAEARGLARGAAWAARGAARAAWAAASAAAWAASAARAAWAAAWEAAMDAGVARDNQLEYLINQIKQL